jgi:hypothetical protein
MISRVISTMIAKILINISRTSKKRKKIFIDSIPLKNISKIMSIVMGQIINIIIYIRINKMLINVMSFLHNAIIS